MSAVIQSLPQDQEPPIIVVGSGPVGVRTVQELLRRDPTTQVILYGAEVYEPYNRVRLSSFLAGDLDFEGLQNDFELSASQRLQLRYGCAVRSIDRERQTVRDATGHTQPYSQLVLATGSDAHVPAIENISLPGVYTFRNFSDAQRLLARRMRSRCTVVLGGGLLGIEAARAMRRFNTQVVIVEHNQRLMPRQLDERAAARLSEHLRSTGLRIELGNGARRILGTDRVLGVELMNGMRLDCDTVIVATGIRPTIELARNAGLSVNRGIRVDDQLRTSDRNIFAVGECAEHRDIVYGLLAPGLEQAAVAAASICGQTSTYLGSTSATRLKVVGLPVFSIGATAPEYMPPGARARTHESADRYCRLVTLKGRLIGALEIGKDTHTGRLQESVARRRAVHPWQLLRFARTGRLWPEQQQEDIASWPPNITVCNCTGVTRGQLTSAVASGCTSIAALAGKTGASTVCGSCKPLLAQLVGNAAAAPVESVATLRLWSVISLLLAAMVLVPWAVPYLRTVDVAIAWDLLWRDGFYKQLSGYTALAMAAVASVMSLRKRVRGFSAGPFPAWRSLHVIVGAIALLVLLVHTGGRLGSNLNLMLSSSFVALAALGAVTALVMTVEHRMGSRGPRVRSRWYWLHLLLFWPVPVLLGMHVLKSYYF